MAGFKDKLDPLLRHRQRLEDEKQRALACLLREKLIIETQLRNEQQAISDDKRLMAGALVGHVDVSRIRQHAGHVSRATANAHRIAQRLAQLYHQIQAARDELSEAMKQRKAVEVLRDRHYRQWLRDARRREAALLDEAAIQKHVRRAREAVA